MPCPCNTKKRSNGTETETEAAAPCLKRRLECPHGQPACPEVVAVSGAVADHPPHSRRLSRTGDLLACPQTPSLGSMMTTYRRRHTSRLSAARPKRRYGSSMRECRLLLLRTRTITRTAVLALIIIIIIVGSSTIRVLVRGWDDRNNHTSTGLPRVGHLRNVRIRRIVSLCDHVSVIHFTAFVKMKLLWV